VIGSFAWHNRGLLAFSYGYGVYETLKVRSGLVYFAGLHEDRLRHSAQLVDIVPDFSPGFFVQAVQDLVTANELTDANIKALLLGDPQGGPPSLWIMALPPFFPSRSDYKKGATAITWPGERYLPGAKSLNMLMSVLAYGRARRQGAYDALLVDRQGFITEGTRTNFFYTDGETCFTAPAERVLAGVTQLTLKHLILEMGINFEERALSLRELGQFQGYALSSTSSKFLPLGQINETKVGLSPIFDSIRKAYDSWLKDYAASGAPAYPW